MPFCSGWQHVQTDILYNNVYLMAWHLFYDMMQIYKG